MADNSWFEGSNSPGAGDLGEIQALQSNLASVAEAARQAKTDLSGLKNQVSDAVWRGTSAEEFKKNVDSTFLGELGQLDASYQDAADGFQAYITSVSGIKQQAAALASKIYSAQNSYEAAAAALRSWLWANPDSGSYSHGDLTAPSYGQGSAYTVSYRTPATPAGATAAAASTAAANAATAQSNHATLQTNVDSAWSTLQGYYGQMHDLKTHDRAAADNAVVGKLSRAHNAGMKNESGWHKFFHALSTVAKWVAVALVVVAVVALCVVAFGPLGLGVLGAIAELTAAGGAAVTVAGMSVSVSSLVLYGSAVASGVALVGDVGQKATGDGPGWGKIGLDVLGIVPGLGKAGSMLSELGGPVSRAISALDDGVVTAKLTSVLHIENLFSKIEYTRLGVAIAPVTSLAEKGVGALNSAVLGFGENLPKTTKFGAAVYGVSKLNGLWGGAGNFAPGISKQAVTATGIAGAKSLTHDVSAATAQQQIAQYQKADPAAAAKAHQLAKNLAQGTAAKVSFPRQHTYPQAVPVR